MVEEKIKAVVDRFNRAYNQAGALAAKGGRHFPKENNTPEDEYGSTSQSNTVNATP